MENNFRVNWCKGGEYSFMRTAAQTAMLMAIFTLISKILGFFREMIMANYFGASYITDAYIMAIAIPSIIFGGILSSVATAYIPIYSKLAENQGEVDASAFTNKVISILLVISAMAAILGIIFSNQIVSVFASGFEGETADLCSFFLKTTFSYLLFTSTIGILESFLQYKGIYLPQIIAGFAMNVVVIITIILSGLFSCYYLAFGWLLGYVIKQVILVIIVRKKEFTYKVNLSLDENIKSIMTLSVPVFIGSSFYQINVFVDKTLASRLPEGSVAALNYGMILITLVTGLTISILTTILYPKLAKANATKDRDRFGSIIETGLTLIAIVAIPCSLGTLLYSHQIVEIVFERGAFDASATLLTASAFFYYGVGLFFISINELMIRAFYSMHNMRTPLVFGAVAVAINIALSITLARVMAHSGLALATSITAFFNSIFLLVAFHRNNPDITIFKSKRKYFYITASSFISVGASYLVYLNTDIAYFSSAIGLVIQLFLAVVIATMIYLILLYLMKVEEIQLIKQIIKR